MPDPQKFAASGLALAVECTLKPETEARTTIHGAMIECLEALDLISIGVAVTGNTGRIILANSVAEEILESGDGLGMSSLGDVRASRRCCAGLADALNDAGKSATGNPRVLAVRRPSGKQPMTLIVRSAKLGSLFQAQDRDEVAVLLLILDPEFRTPAVESDLRELYALTGTEARLSNLLMSGRTVDDCREEMGVSRLTLYSHLKRLFRKIGVQSQGELVSVLLKGVGAVSTKTVVKERGTVWSRYCRNRVPKPPRANYRAPLHLSEDASPRLSLITQKDPVRSMAYWTDAAIGNDPRTCVDALNQSISEWKGCVAELADRDPDERLLRLPMASFAAFDVMSIGVAAIDSAGHLLIANNTAHQMLESSDGLQFNSRGEVRFSKSNGPSLSQFLKRIDAGTSQRQSKATIIAIERPFGKRPLTVLLRPAMGFPNNRNSAASVTLMIVFDPQLSVNTEQDDLRELYGFTSTEARIANLLMDGKTIDQCCREFGIRSTTIRMHIRNMFHKTGVHKQSQLISLLLKSVGLVKTGSKMPLARTHSESTTCAISGNLSGSAAAVRCTCLFHHN